MARSRISWIAVEQDYIAGIQGPQGHYYPSTAELAVKYGVDINAVQHHCKRKGWVRKREAYQEEFSVQLRENRQKYILAEFEAFDIDMLRAMTALKNVAFKKLFIANANTDETILNSDLPIRDYKRLVDSLSGLLDVRDRVKVNVGADKARASKLALDCCPVFGPPEPGLTAISRGVRP